MVKSRICPRVLIHDVLVGNFPVLSILLVIQIKLVADDSWENWVGRRLTDST